jgi:hypothetical protein
MDSALDHKYVIDNYPNSKEAKLCPGRITFCEKYSNANWSTRRGYFLAVADTTNDADLKYECKASAAWCLVEMDQIQNAQSEFLILLDQADTYYKYEKTSLLSAMSELENPPWEGINAPGSIPPDRTSEVLARMEEILNNTPVLSTPGSLPTKYALYQNYPNPFNPTTEIRFDLPEAQHVQLKVFNTLGQTVATLIDENRPAGAYRISWDGSRVASGLYIYQIKAGKFTDTKKMVLMR